MPEYANQGLAGILGKDEIKDVKFFLTNPVLRDIYDKHGTGITEAQFEEQRGVP